MGDADATSEKNVLSAALVIAPEKYPGGITIATSAPAAAASFERVTVWRVELPPLGVG
jgi:hypothetical protein